MQFGGGGSGREMVNGGRVVSEWASCAEAGWDAAMLSAVRYPKTPAPSCLLTARDCAPL